MLAIPLPFVIAVLLVILLWRVVSEGESASNPVVLFLAACILMVVFVGLRWSVDWSWPRFLQPVFAAMLPPIAWLCFSQTQSSGGRIWPHFIMPAVIFLLSALWHRLQPPIDIILAILFMAYGCALLKRAYSPAEFAKVRLSEMGTARHAAQVVGGALLVSAIVDLSIAADFGYAEGRHAAMIVAAANLLLLPVISYALTIVGRSVPDEHDGAEDHATASYYPPEMAAAAPTMISADDLRIMEIVTEAMSSRRFYRDPDLTLRRLSRRIGLPERQISSAINRSQGCTVSQYVNSYRIIEAQQLLSQTDMAITSIMFECGFQTKSNFNREFARLVAMTPSDYRRSQRQDAMRQ